MLLHAAAGYTFVEIAKKLIISEPTVRCYSYRIRQKLYAQNLRHAVVIALRNGLFTQDEILALEAGE
jgi:DNA-binding CsgD family transcriptional regulator